MSTGPSLIRILAVDDHPMLREGIAALVASQSDMKLVGEASTGREALEQFRKHRPDLTLMDLQMPDMDGIQATVAICSEFPEARIIILTTYKGDVQVLRALKAGARAYLLKGLLRKELLETIRAVHAGQKRIPPEVAAELADHAIDDALTAREIDVLRLIAGGNANKLIADRLSITEETVKGHVKNILSKLGASDRTHAVTVALKRGIIDLYPPRKRGGHPAPDLECQNSSGAKHRFCTTTKLNGRSCLHCAYRSRGFHPSSKLLCRLLRRTIARALTHTQSGGNLLSGWRLEEVLKVTVFRKDIVEGLIHNINCRCVERPRTEYLSRKVHFTAVPAGGHFRSWDQLGAGSSLRVRFAVSPPGVEV